jgi:hypothetical protein
MGTRRVHRPAEQHRRREDGMTGTGGLQEIGGTIRRRLAGAQSRGRLPGPPPGTPRRRTDIDYQAYVSRDLRTGTVTVNVKIRNYGRLCADPRDPAAQRLAADVDEVVGRDTFSPPLAGRTTFAPGTL